MSFVALERLVLLCAVVSSLTPATARAVTFRYTGTVVSFVENGDLTGGRLAVGDVVRVRYTFDPITPDLNAHDFIGYYALQSVTYRLGTALVSITPTASSRIRVADNAPMTVDEYEVDVVEFGNGTLDGIPAYAAWFSFSMADFDGAVFADESLPVVPPPLDAFDSFRLGHLEVQMSGLLLGPWVIVALRTESLVSEPSGFATAMVCFSVALCRHRRANLHRSFSRRDGFPQSCVTAGSRSGDARVRTPRRGPRRGWLPLTAA
jgi:hypothetical protein